MDKEKTKESKGSSSNKNKGMVSDNDILEINKNLDKIGQFFKSISSYIKWIASISIFLITVSLTILALKSNILVFNKVTGSITIALFLCNIYFCWKLLQNLIYVPVMELLSQLMIKKDSKYFLEEGKDIYSKLIKIINKYRSTIDITFFMGFLSFIIYLFGMIL